MTASVQVLKRKATIHFGNRDLEDGVLVGTWDNNKMSPNKEMTRLCRALTPKRGIILCVLCNHRNNNYAVQNEWLLTMEQLAGG